jgi:hypothetical protein
MRIATTQQHFVIPAKAGIHFAPALYTKSKVKMGPGFRRDDGKRNDMRLPKDFP